MTSHDLRTACVLAFVAVPLIVIPGNRTWYCLCYRADGLIMFERRTLCDIRNICLTGPSITAPQAALDIRIMYKGSVARVLAAYFVHYCDFRDFKDTVYPFFESDTLFLE